MSVKIASNALSIESVSTKVPLTVATPRTIAIAVSAVRSLRPSIPFRANLIIYSYCSAVSGSSFAARRAGVIAAITPTITATTVSTTSWPQGTANRTSNSSRARVTSTARKMPSGTPIAAPIRAVITLS